MTRVRIPLLAALAVGTLVGTAACQDASAPVPAAVPGSPVSLRVLFIGNSLTYYNNLPGTLKGVALTAGDTIHVEMIAKPNYALIDHITNNSGAVEAIKRGGWDFVVLQQGPTTLPINRDSLVLWTRMFDSIIHPTGARTALFMVWPQGASAQGFESVRIAYQDAASAVDGLFLPAGVAWQLALQRDGLVGLYGPDNFHPTPLGSYLAAITIYGELTGRDVRDLPDVASMDGKAMNTPTATVSMLQEAAHEADAKY
jgi:hypothetical protein